MWKVVRFISKVYFLMFNVLKITHKMDSDQFSIIQAVDKLNEDHDQIGIIP